MGTEIATAPATALSTNPAEMHITSIITIFFKTTEYKMFKIKYVTTTSIVVKLTFKDNANDTINMTIVDIDTAVMDTAPEAIGRFDFTGCSLSFSRSKTSLIM
jgi:hypothetical protein